MTAPRKKKRAKTPARRKASVARKRKPRATPRSHPGLPAPDSVRAVVKFVSPKKVRYTILKTSEMDAYDKP
jgi:hypothetical protein